MKKICLALVLSAVLVFALIVPASASINYTQVHWGYGYGFGGGNRTSGSATYLSYSELTALCREVNNQMKTGFYDTSDVSFKKSKAIITSATDADGSYYHIYTIADDFTYTLRNSDNGYVRTTSETTVTPSVPDTGTTTPTTPTITFDDTNIVNAVEGVFDQLTWVIRCQFEQMQDTLLNGRILLNINNLISKNIIPYVDGISTTESGIFNLLSVFYSSFESKFSDLDTIFGTDTSMEVHNGDLLTWDNLSRGFTSAEADGTATTIRLTPTRMLSGYNVGWTEDGNFSITPVNGGYFPDTLNVGTGTVTMPVIKTTEPTTVANPKLNQYVPEGYTQYERCSGAIDLGITPQSGMMLDTGLALTSTTSLSRLQYFFGTDGLSMAISEDKQSLVVTSGSSTYNWAHDFSTSKTVSMHLYWTFGSSWRLGSMSSGASLAGFPSNPKTLYLAGVNTTSSYTRPSSTWHDIQFKDSSGNLLYHFVPVKRDSDGTAGLYRVEYNAGVYSGGTFLTAEYVNVYDEIPATVEATVTKSGNITRIYRDTSNTWRAVDSEGTVHGFTAASAQVLWEAFPIYDYDDLSDLTSLPDGTYRFTWEGTAQAVIINYQAYSKWFAYIANQIAYNRNWLDQRLDRLSFNGAGSEFDDTDIIDAIQHIPAYDDSGLISAVDNVSNIIVEQFGKNESQVNLPYIGMNVSERVRGVRLDSFDFIDLTSSSGSYVYVSESPLYYAGISRNKTGVGDISFSSAFASDPDDVVMDVSFTETVFTEVPTKAHPMVYTYSIELPKAQLDAAGVRYGDCIWRSFSLPVMDRTAYIFDARIPINGQTSTTYIASMEFHPSWDASGEWIGWCDDTDTVYESMLEPTRLYHHSEVDMSSGVWYLYSTEPFSFDVVYASRFTAFLQAQFDRVVDASGTGDITMSPTDLTPVITSIDAVGVNIEDLNANFNTSLGSLVDKLDVIVDKSSESVENLTVEISVDNDAHNVFYVTDEDGNEESLVDFSGDVLKAGGKLLNFLFKVCFDGAIDNLDGSIDDMDSFYFDGAELGGSLWE